MVAAAKERWRNFFCPATLLEKTVNRGGIGRSKGKAEGSGHGDAEMGRRGDEEREENRFLCP
jgi:hypothetical protein